MNQKIVPGYGPLDAKIVVIGDAPGEDDVRQEVPFIGPAGQFLRKKLLRNGITPDVVRFDHLMQFRPEKGKFELFLASEEYSKILEQRVINLHEQIRAMGPNVVFLLGASALKYLGKKHGIDSWRGHVFWSDEMNCKVIASYRPLDCIRQRFVSPDNYPGQYETLFDIDTERVSVESETRSMYLPSYNLMLNPNFDQAMSELERIYATAQELAFDIEIVRGTFTMTCIGFASNPHEAVCIPFYNMNPIRPIPFWKTEREAGQMLQMVEKLLTSDIPKIAQNSQFDMCILDYQYKIRVQNLTWDTMVAAHNIYCELPKDLGSLVSIYTRFPYHKHLIDEGSNMGYWEYNALDALTTFHIKARQKKEMQELGILDHYMGVTQPLIRPLIDMQLTGVKVDERFKDEAHRLEEEKIEGIREAINCILPSVNLGSHQQLKVLFYEIFGCRKRYNKNTLTVDETALESILASDPRRLVQVLCRAILKYREYQGMIGVLKTPLFNGRLHTGYDATGTVSGRLNSKKSIFGKGRNLQNLSKGPQRAMVIPG